MSKNGIALSVVLVVLAVVYVCYFTDWFSKETIQIIPQIRPGRPSNIQRMPPPTPSKLSNRVSNSTPNKLVGESRSSVIPAPLPVSDEEFESALNEVTGCTAGSNSMERLLNERRQDLQREEAFLHDRSK